MVKLNYSFGDKEYDAAVEALEKQDDRSAAIVAASLVESQIVIAIKRQFVQQDPKVEGEFMKGYGPLATFRSRIDLGFFLGFYNIKCHQTLLRVKDVRNRMAHQIKPHDFETQEIKDIMNFIPSIEEITNCWKIMRDKTPEKTSKALENLIDSLSHYPNSNRGKYMCYIHHRLMSLVTFAHANPSDFTKGFVLSEHL